MAEQKTFFETFDRQRLVQPCDVNVEPEDVQRLTGQNAAILARLRRGPATNDELIQISRKYTGRISDLRKAGYTINCTRGRGGLNTYTLQQ